MAKKSKKTDVTPTTATAVEVTPVAAATVTTLPEFDLLASIRALHAGAPLGDTFTVPAPYAALVDAIREVFGEELPREGRDLPFYQRVTRAFEGAMAARLPDAPVPSRVNTTHWLGLGIQDAQDVVYHALAVSGVFVSADLVCCIWRALAPRAACGYLTTGVAKGYATTTLSAYMRGEHGTNPWFPGAVEAIRPWYVAGGVTHAPKAK